MACLRLLTFLRFPGTPIGALFGNIGLSSGGSAHDAAVFTAVCKALASGTFLQVRRCNTTPHTNRQCCLGELDGDNS